MLFQSIPYKIGSKRRHIKKPKDNNSTKPNFIADLAWLVLTRIKWSYLTVLCNAEFQPAWITCHYEEQTRAVALTRPYKTVFFDLFAYVRAGIFLVGFVYSSITLVNLPIPLARPFNTSLVSLLSSLLNNAPIIDTKALFV